MMRQIPLSCAALFLLTLSQGCGCVVPARARLLSHNEAGRAYDQTSLIEPSSFSEPILRESFKKLLAEKTGRFPLVRWTVGTTEEDVARAVGGPGCSFENPRDGNWLRTSMIAQFVYRNGALIERLKNHERVMERILKGNTDPLHLTIDGARMHLESFYIHSDTGTADPLVQFYVIATPLPSSEQAAAALKALLAIFGVHRAGLVVRSDSFFGRFDGPIIGAFNPPYEDVNEQQFMLRPYVGCSAGPAEAHCAKQFPAVRSRLADCM